MKIEFWNSEPRRSVLICSFLVLATACVYWQVHAFAFTNYDELFLILKNPIVRGGITPEGIVWALTTSWFEYWHPVTWLSFMLDCELFGLDAGWHHVVNLLFHIVDSVLVFAVLRRLTGATWRSAMVAALFALHPVHVESVAWVAERKDVLSALFFLLTIWAYGRYAEERKGQDPKFKLWYASALGLFALGLMSKPMLITVPFVLLLLDYWPLKRLDVDRESSIKDLWALLKEKVPFFALTVASTAISYFGVRAGGNILSAETVPWSLRMANVPVSYVRYLLKVLWPTRLAVLYPMPSHLPSWEVIGSVLILIAITVLVLLRIRSSPYLAVGWFTFLGVLVPIIGLVQAGFQAIADRYTYIPSIGLFVAMVWAAGEGSVFLKLPKRWTIATAALVLGGCGLVAWHQVGYWRDSLTLWTHCVSVTPGNAIAHYNLGYALEVAGSNQPAMNEYQEALRINPNHVNANVNLGTIYILRNHMQEATNCLANALRLRPDSAPAHANLALALRELGDYQGAIMHCNEAIRLNPASDAPFLDMARSLSAVGRSRESLTYYEESVRRTSSRQSHYFYGLELLKLGEFQQAVDHLKEAVHLAPDWADAHLELAVALSAEGVVPEAVAQYREVLRLDPNSALARNNLSWILATHPDPSLRNGPEAVKLAQEACERTSWKQTVFVGTLSAAYAEAGEYEKAMETSRRACELASSLGETNLLARNQALLLKFQHHEPCRQAN
jgi:tetratricopeptide (TPR) repeat protein